MKVKLISISVAVITLLHSASIAQTSSNYLSDVRVVPSSCLEETGSIILELSQINLTIMWEDGSSEPELTGLSSGVYGVTIYDEVGCSESLSIEVPNAECSFEVVVTEYPNPGGAGICAKFELIFTINGLQVNSNLIDVAWQVGEISSNGTIAYAGCQNSPINVSVSAGLNEPDGLTSCCEFYDEFTFTPDQKPEKPTVYVQKATIKDQSDDNNVPGLLQLIVYGDGACEGMTDLRGYIIDDNNGQLVTIEESEDDSVDYEDANISPGFLRFTNHENWAAVPNGSIIHIYESKHPQNDQVSNLDDPTDENEDYLYILNESNIEYFSAHESSWNDTLMMLEYEEVSVSLDNDWGLIKMSGITDGIQVRYPNGAYCHGVSFGSNSYTSDTIGFQLYLESTPYEYGKIEMHKLSYENPEDFSILQEYGGFVAGSIEPMLLDTLIALRECQNSQFASGRNGSLSNGTALTIGENEVQVHPNPFETDIMLTLTPSSAGTMTITVYDNLGREHIRHIIECQPQTYSLPYTIEKPYADNIFFLKVDFPDGSSKQKNLIMINP